MQKEVIVHITDTHIGKNLDFSERLEALVEHVGQHYNPRETTIFHTGDCTEGGVFDFRLSHHEREFEDFVRIMDPLEKEGFTIIVAPGNHDVGRQGITADRELRAMYGHHVRALMPWSTLTEESMRDGTAYPLFYFNGRVNWCLQALDSTVGQLGRDGPFDLARGNVGLEQRRRARAQLMRFPDMPKATGFHHDPWYLKWTNRLTDAADVKDLLADCGVKFNLGGHRHLNDRHEYRGVTHLKSHRTVDPLDGEYVFQEVTICSDGTWYDFLKKYR